jgi:hypothetical protein
MMEDPRAERVGPATVLEIESRARVEAFDFVAADRALARCRNIKPERSE